MEGGFHDRRARFDGLIKRPHESGILFRALRQNIIGAKRDAAFFVPDNAMLAILMRGCHERKIRIPRNGAKTVIAPDLMVGIRIVMEDEKLTLE